MAKKPIPLGVMIPLDAVLVAGSLLTFAYFHHVRPQSNKADEDLLRYIDTLQQNTPDSEEVTGSVPAETTISAELQGDGDVTAAAEDAQTTDVTNTDESGNPVTTTSGSGRTTAKSGTTASGRTQPGETGTSGTSGTAKSGSTTTKNGGGAGTTKTTAKTTAPTTTTTTTTALQYDLSGFGAKWPTLFSLGDEVEITDTFYRSHDVYINITPYTYADSNCYVADIYVRSYENFKYAFAQDGDPNTYAGGLVTGLQENMVNMCARTGAILAVNGDFMGGRQIGYVIRSGYPWRTEPWGDVAALYTDGAVDIFSKDEFDVYAAFDRGIWHSFAFGPALVRNGVQQSGFTAGHLTGKEPRSGFGYYEPGHYCFVAVDGRGMGGSQGMTADEFAGFFAWLGCYHGFNLDGGKTSQLCFNGNIVNLPDGYNGNASSLRGMSDIYYIGEVG